MPAKLTIPSTVIVSTQNTTLALTNLTNGYMENSDMHLVGTTLVIDQSKKYYVGFSVAIEQNGTGVTNMVEIQVRRNGNNILSNTFSYNVNDEITIGNAAYIHLNANDVITVNVNFTQLSPNKLFILANPASTFLNII